MYKLSQPCGMYIGVVLVGIYSTGGVGVGGYVLFTGSDERCAYVGVVTSIHRRVYERACMPTQHAALQLVGERGRGV